MLLLSLQVLQSFRKADKDKGIFINLLSMSKWLLNSLSRGRKCQQAEEKGQTEPASCCDQWFPLAADKQFFLLLWKYLTEEGDWGSSGCLQYFLPSFSSSWLLLALSKQFSECGQLNSGLWIMQALVEECKILLGTLRLGAEKDYNYLNGCSARAARL